MKRSRTAVLPGIVALLIGGAVLVYGVTSGGMAEVSFSDPSVLLAGVFIALGLTLLLLAPRAE